HGQAQQVSVHLFLEAAVDVALDADDVGEQQFVAVPVGVERLVKRYFRPGFRGPAQVHQDFVLDAARGVSGQLDVLGRVERVDRLDKADRADGNQVFHGDARVFKLAGDVDDE